MMMRIAKQTNSTAFGPQLRTLRLPSGAEIMIEVRKNVALGHTSVAVVDPSGLDFYAVGSTPEHASRDLVVAILEAHAHLEANRDRLGRMPARQLRLLRRLLEPEIRGRRASSTPMYRIGSGSSSDSRVYAR